MSEPSDVGDAGGRGSEAFSNYFVGDSTMGEALERMCRSAIDAVPPSVLAGVSMTVDARVGTYVFTHPDVVLVDQAQYDTGDGPCVDSFITGEHVIIDSTLRPGPYPDFREVAAGYGLLSVLSLPMNTGAQTVGALNLYARIEDAYGEDAVRRGQVFATQAAFLLLNHQAYWDAQSLSENLEQAMRSRAEIEQAKGIIMASTGVSAEVAFDHLRQQSQHENVKLRDIAREIVERAANRKPPGSGGASTLSLQRVERAKRVVIVQVERIRQVVPPPFAIVVSIEERQVVVTVCGEVDIGNVDQLRDVITSAADGGQPVRVDLTNVTFVDASMLRALVSCRARSVHQLTDLKVRNPTDAVRRVFEITGTTFLIE
jgi:anti-anti-sigma factor